MEPRKVYHLQTHKATSINEDRTTNIESILVKLDSTHLLQKYCLFLKQDGIIAKNPPYIKKVMIDGKDAGDDARKEAQAVMDKILKPVAKQVSDKQKVEELEKRLAALEAPNQRPTKQVIDGPREQLEAKAKELNIAFRSNVGNEKLLLRIQEIEPEYEI